MQILSFLASELRETWKRPGRMLAVINPAKVTGFLRFQKLRWSAKGGWTDGNGGISSRRFSSYEDYVRLQQSKLGYLDLAAHESRFRAVLRERLKTLALIPRGARVLCLGARLGAEVAAFRDIGAFAVGVDLNPGKENPWVMFGDFHRLEFPDGVLDFVYSNSLDHSFEFSRVLAEVGRLLTDSGYLIVEADPGVEDANGVAPDLWASVQWPTVDALADIINKLGFEPVCRANFDYPRRGTCLVFRKRLASSQG